MINNLKTSPAGIDLIKEFEGCELKAYQDTDNIWTIGYGYTGPEVHHGLTWTQAQADQALTKKLAEFEKDINTQVKVKLNQNQFDALVCFVYNIGDGHFEQSSALKVLNQGKYSEVGQHMLLWDRDNHGVSPGLLRRRKAEVAMFNGGHNA